MYPRSTSTYFFSTSLSWDTKLASCFPEKRKPLKEKTCGRMSNNVKRKYRGCTPCFSLNFSRLCFFGAEVVHGLPFLPWIQRICLYETVPEMNAADRASGTRNTVVNTHSFSFDHVHLGAPWRRLVNLKVMGWLLWKGPERGAIELQTVLSLSLILSPQWEDLEISGTTMGGHPGIYHLSC